MTDIEKWRDFLASFGVGFKEKAGAEMPRGTADSRHLKIAEGYPKVDGWPRFHADISFTEDGSFVGIGVWE